MNNNYRPKYPLQALERALDVIDCLAAQSSGRGLGISELSKISGLGKSTVHRILDTLAAHNYVEKYSDQNRYRLGWRLFELGNIVPSHHIFFNFDFTILQDLCSKYGETVNLGIPAETGVAIISKVESETNLKANLQVGRHVPYHATALGKTLLSEINDEKALNIKLSAVELTRYTLNTITSQEGLLQELEKVRKNGYAIDDEEYYQGLCCVAMPIKNHREEIVGALSVSGPSIRLNFNKILEISKGLKEATIKLSVYLGSKCSII